MLTPVLLAVLGSLHGDAVRLLNDSVPVEFEQLTTFGWRWFVLPTDDAAAVTAGLVVQRGLGNRFPRMGFVMMASSSGIPPGSLSVAEYDPRTYVHDDPEGPRRRFVFEEESSSTDWRVMTLGFDDNRTDSDADLVQVPLNEVLVGVRCNEFDWFGAVPGCRYSLTATLLPFAIAHNVSVSAPMERGRQHVYRLTLGEYDSLNISLTRDVRNATDSDGQPRGLVGVAMLGNGWWSRPAPLEFPCAPCPAAPCPAS